MQQGSVLFARGKTPFHAEPIQTLTDCIFTPPYCMGQCKRDAVKMVGSEYYSPIARKKQKAHHVDGPMLAWGFFKVYCLPRLVSFSTI